VGTATNKSDVSIVLDSQDSARKCSQKKRSCSGRVRDIDRVVCVN